MARSKYTVHLLLYSDKAGEGPILVYLPFVVCAKHRAEMTPVFLTASPEQRETLANICRMEHREVPGPGKIRVGFRTIHRGRKKRGTQPQ